jgi:hypothetical protein
LERFLLVSQVSDGVQQLDVSQVRAATAAGLQTAQPATTAAAAVVEAVVSPQATLMPWLHTHVSKQHPPRMVLCYQHTAGTYSA